MELQPTLTIGAVAIAPSNPSIMYAASGEDGGDWNPAWSGVGIYRSSNGGNTWTLMTRVPSTRFSAIVVHPKHPDVISSRATAVCTSRSTAEPAGARTPGLNPSSTVKSPMS